MEKKIKAILLEVGIILGILKKSNLKLVILFQCIAIHLQHIFFHVSCQILATKAKQITTSKKLTKIFLSVMKQIFCSQVVFDLET